MTAVERLKKFRAPLENDNLHVIVNLEDLDEVLKYLEKLETLLTAMGRPPNA